MASACLLSDSAPPSNNDEVSSSWLCWLRENGHSLLSRKLSPFWLLLNLFSAPLKIPPLRSALGKERPLVRRSCLSLLNCSGLEPRPLLLPLSLRAGGCGANDGDNYRSKENWSFDIFLESSITMSLILRRDYIFSCTFYTLVWCFFGRTLSSIIARIIPLMSVVYFASIGLPVARIIWITVLFFCTSIGNKSWLWIGSRVDKRVICN